MTLNSPRRSRGRGREGGRDWTPLLLLMSWPSTASQPEGKAGSEREADVQRAGCSIVLPSSSSSSHPLIVVLSIALLVNGRAVVSYLIVLAAA